MDAEESVEVTNVVATGRLGREIDTSQLKEDIDFADSTYNQTQRAVVFRFDGHTGVLILYPSGMYIFKGIDGYKSLEKIHELFISGLEELGIEHPEEKSLEIKNVVCSGSLGRDIRLDELISDLDTGEAEYEPEQFPSIVYRPTDKESTFLIFGSGKTVITGASSEKIAIQEFSELKTKLTKF